MNSGVYVKFTAAGVGSRFPPAGRKRIHPPFSRAVTFGRQYLR
jgi:hypothetical protein